MRERYPIAASLRSVIRISRSMCVILFALGSSIALLLRILSHPAVSKRVKAEEAMPCYPTKNLGELQKTPPGIFATLTRWVASQNGSHTASLNFATILPGLRQPSGTAAVVPPSYPALEEFEYQLEELARKFPRLVHKQIIGTSTTHQRPIWAMRVTDNPGQDEDEPAVLFTALHHAREPAGVFICMAIMQELLNNYGRSTRYTRLIDSLDIWIVPLVNPDGYKYLLESQRQFPWWRKNLRDNNGDGSFDPLIDGVDLNRNYDYNWEEGGEGEHGSWFYRGNQAFSETEIQALRDLEWRRNFVIGVSFHSYGEAILYPWGNFNPAPDEDLILDIAEKYANEIGRLHDRGSYGVLPLNGRVGQSSVWMYGASSAIDFICETGTDYFPASDDLPDITAQNVRGVCYLLERALRSGVYGHVRDAQSGEPLEAEILVAGREAQYVKPRHSQGSYGRYDRLLLPGTYAITIHKSGYRSERLEQVVVNDSTLTRLEVALRREADRPAVTSH